MTTPPEPPPCPNHSEVQHRDGKPPWCRICGWNRGRPAIPPRQIRDAPSPLQRPREPRD